MLLQHWLSKKVCGCVFPAYLFFTFQLLSAFLVSDAAPAAIPDPYQQELVDKAKEQNISRDPYWDTLVHYKRSGAGKKSLIDDPKFFLAPTGKIDPEAELAATLRAFFQEAREKEEHPRCRFIARYDWLKERLQIDETKLPPASCAKLDEALSNIKYTSAVLVFPAAHGNGPASMFGHTLIRIDSGFKNDLLSHAVNYAASAEDSNGFVYAFKGIFGYYKGQYSILPYYEKVREYNGIEHRDIWEYSLNLNEDEIRRMVLHIWELKDIYSDYYFVDENCSFDLLFLLEAARPSVRLTDVFWEGGKFWVIPVDTIRVVQESGMIRDIRYRPSQATRIRFIASELKPADQKLALEVIDKKILPQDVAERGATPESRKKILDLSAELLQYRYSSRKLAKEEYLKQFLPVLKARSELGTSPADATEIKPPVSPEKGHLPGKVSAAAGYAAQSPFTEIAWRMVYHDLLDADEGYVEGAAISFFDLRTRYYFKEQSVRLQSAHFIDITSLAPRDRFFKPVSWKMLTGFDREFMPHGGESLVYRINPGSGLAWKAGSHGLAYVLLESDLTLGSTFKNNYSLGVGPSAGILATVTDFWKIHVAAQRMFYELGERHQSSQISFEQNVSVATNNSLRLSVSEKKNFEQHQSEVKLTWSLYL